MAEPKYTMDTSVDLEAEQRRTEDTPVMRANPILRLMYATMDFLYGKDPSLAKFKVIEFLARYPYWAWETGGYARMSRAYSQPRCASEGEIAVALRHIDMGREAQDNEQWHLMLIEEIMRKEGIEQGFGNGVLMPRLMAFGYLILTKAMYRIKPEWLFAMNARFESHAEHEYMKLAQWRPEWNEQPVESEWLDPSQPSPTMADLFRHIGLDERRHMEESMEEYQRLTGRELA